MTRHALALLLVAGTLVGCSAAPSPTTSDPRPTPTPSTSPTPLTAPVSTDALVDRGLTAEPVPGSVGTAVGVEPCPDVETDGYGTYSRVCLRDDAPILAFDPQGPYSWLALGVPYPVRPDFTAAQIPVAARFLLGALADPVTQWDDSPAAWARTNAELDTLFGEPGHDLRPEDPASDAVMGLFDAGGWRGAAGLRPAATTAGQTRTRVDTLEISGLSGSSVGEATVENQGLTVDVKAVTSAVVLDDHVAWELRRGVLAHVRSVQSTGLVDGVEWSAWHAVGREVAGGVDALPVLATQAAVPDGWVVRDEVPGLSFALPPDAGEPEVTTGDEPGTTYTYTFADSGAQVRVERRYVPRGDAGRWFARRDHESYGLRVPGIRYAAAEAGTSPRGRYLVTVDLVTEPPADPEGGDDQVGAYTVTWESTGQTATEEIRERIGTFSHSWG
ncbi:hypothetical protein H9657_10365 [Cellulomonas sp. Sa3CUA2]|uniref:Lipoprotein n=1 Tax=Cellulomonas avistercoris TaxID=2762242 RepID=A0ABR8QE76_9CELL|nr:hypothetical protein [Cellulomonas avistercoris]MBD7918676.1 hypothetical protein [Cellulomonas avistercoris]